MNPNHDEKTGQFSSGSSGAAATGDHQAVSPSATARNVAGRTVDRSRPVTRHNGARSVGTDSSGGGGGGGGGGGDGGSRLSSAARDAIIRQKGIDQRG